MAVIQRASPKGDAPYEQPHGKACRTWVVVALLLVIHSGLLAYSAYVHSPTLNEPGHLVAGISHWRFGRFELFRVNPPLVRMVAALPVMVAGVEADWSNFYDGPGARPVFRMGGDLVAANGERSFDLFMLARWACAPFSWIGGIVCFVWARDLYGPMAGLLATTLWCFSPNILAHASLITADAPAAALCLAACYAFWKWARRPTWRLTFLAGAALGVAGATKLTLVILFPLWPLLWILYRLPEREKTKSRDWLSEGAMLTAQIAIAIYVINIGYGFERSGRPLGEFRFVSSAFSQEASGVVGNRFEGTWLADVPVPFPENYILGMDIQRYDFENSGRSSYLRGEWRDTGWWYYYLYALAIKVPLGTWALLLLALALRLLGQRPAQLPRDELFLLAPAIVILTLVSSQTGLSEHMRYLLPILPFFFIWAGSLWKESCASPRAVNSTRGDGAMARTRSPVGNTFPWCIAHSRVTAALAGIGLFWSASSSLWIYPHSLSYFNESVGGPENGHKHLLGSNVDWGQDLRYLKWWLEEHPEARPLGNATFGLYDPSDLGVEMQRLAVQYDDSSSGCCFKSNPGWHAVSSNLLLGHSWLCSTGEGGTYFDYQKLCEFRQRDPVRRVGYSISVYEVR